MILETMPVGPLKANCYLLGCEQTGQGAIIDAGGDAGAILDRLCFLRLSLRFLLNTHGHFDHVGAVRELHDATGAEFLIHERETYFSSSAATAAADFGLAAENAPEPDRFLEHGMRIHLGRYVLQVIHTPGHSPGGCCFWCRSEGIVFTGDTLFNGSVGRVDLPGASLHALQRSIRQNLFTLNDCTRVYPGHGTSTTIGRERLINHHVPRG
ncbi:MAG TPA: MBL fold metallo-hydrolase [Geobacteraceae bacterium]|nr:MBL fold metallo-hydrolase [Geobacteraceae bacterium]